MQKINREKIKMAFAPLVSIIIPAFNEERHLRQAIMAIRKSIAVAASSHISAELIVVDNESTDNTRKVAEKLADHAYSESRHVIAAVRNTGAFHAKGKYFIFVDADTLIPPALVKDFVNILAGGAVTVGCNVMPSPLNPFERAVFKTFNLVLRASVSRGAAFSGNCVGYRRDVFEKLAGFDEERVASEDHDLSNRASKLGKAVFLKHLTVLTSNRRIRNLGLVSVLFGWGKTTAFYLFGLKRKKYRIARPHSRFLLVKGKAQQLPRLQSQKRSPSWRRR